MPLRLLLRLIAFALSRGDLAVDVGLLSHRSSVVALGLGLEPLDPLPVAIERAAHSLERVLTSRPVAPLTVEPLLALVGEPFALVGDSFALIGATLAAIGTTVALVRYPVALVRDHVPFICLALLLGWLRAQPLTVRGTSSTASV